MATYMSIGIHVLQRDLMSTSLVIQTSVLTGCRGAWYSEFTTNCTAGEEMGYCESKVNLSANFSPFDRRLKSFQGAHYDASIVRSVVGREVMDDTK